MAPRAQRSRAGLRFDRVRTPGTRHSKVHLLKVEDFMPHELIGKYLLLNEAASQPRAVSDESAEGLLSNSGHWAIIGKRTYKQRLIVTATWSVVTLLRKRQKENIQSVPTTVRLNDPCTWHLQSFILTHFCILSLSLHLSPPTIESPLVDYLAARGQSQG